MIETRNHVIKNRHGLNVSVLVELPRNPRGLAFIMHAFTSAKHRPTASAQAQTTLKNNLITVRFDTTHSTGESDGSPELATITSFLEDLTDVITWAKNQEWYQEPFILSGSSLGGIAILEYAHLHPHKVKAVAPVAPVISGELSIEAYKAFRHDKLKQWQDTGFVEVETNKSMIQVPWSHMEDRMNYNALSYAADIMIPVFLLVGEKDTSCPPTHQQKLYDALGTRNKELHIVEDIPHQWHSEDALNSLQNLFDKWLKKILA